MSKITVTTLAGHTSGSDANKVKVESGDTLEVVSNATVGGDLAVDTNVLKVDSSNNRVGIGTASPTQDLTIVNSGSARMELVSGTSGTSIIDMGDSADKDIGGIRYLQGSDTLQFRAGNDVRMSVDSLGRVSTPQQPYFEACFSTSAWTNYATGGTWVKMDFDATLTNVGGHYDTTNKRFVAPVTGKYFMSAAVFLNVTWNSATPYLSYIGFYKNNAFFAHFGQDVQSTEHIRHGIIMPLNANDYVDIRIQQAQTPATNQYYKQANGRNYTYFHGMLIG